MSLSSEEDTSNSSRSWDVGDVRAFNAAQEVESCGDWEGDLGRGGGGGSVGDGHESESEDDVGGESEIVDFDNGRNGEGGRLWEEDDDDDRLGGEDDDDGHFFLFLGAILYFIFWP